MKGAQRLKNEVERMVLEKIRRHPRRPKTSFCAASHIRRAKEGHKKLLQQANLQFDQRLSGVESGGKQMANALGLVIDGDDGDSKLVEVKEVLS